MGMKQLRSKLRQQRTRRRWGTFNPFSDPALNNGSVYISTALRQYSAQKVKTDQSVDRSPIPKDYREYFNYRAHAKGIAREDMDEHSPRHWLWLYSMFGSSRFVSDERRAAQELARLLPEKTQSELFFRVSRTRLMELRLYFTPRKDCWWYMEIAGRQVRTSYTFGSKQRALAAVNTIHWKVVSQFPLSPPPS